MKIIWYIIIGVIVLMLLLCLIYFVLLIKLKNLNAKIYKFKQEIVEGKENVLIVYQPSLHKTTINLSHIIKEEVINKGYGCLMHTLNKKHEDYSRYKYVIFVAPVYFGEIHREFINKISQNKIKNLIIIYNGLNNESNKENEEVKLKCISKYSTTKIYSTNIEVVRQYIQKEVL